MTLQVPAGYDSTRPTPLLLVLHGYGANGLVQVQYLRLAPLVDSEGVLLVAPDGSFDQEGSRFWNATPGCCDFSETGVDDVGYLRGLITEIRKDYNVDSHRIYVVGHSNGGFMAHRLACDMASEIAAIVSLAGATYKDPASCKPSEPVSILGIHGDADDTILYEGGVFNGGYPGALETIQHWQVYDRCAPALSIQEAVLDLDRDKPGVDSDIYRYTGCASGTEVELWRIHGGEHIPVVTRNFGNLVWDWLVRHPKQ